MLATDSRNFQVLPRRLPYSSFFHYKKRGFIMIGSIFPVRHKGMPLFAMFCPDVHSLRFLPGHGRKPARVGRTPLVRGWPPASLSELLRTHPKPARVFITFGGPQGHVRQVGNLRPIGNRLSRGHYATRPVLPHRDSYCGRNSLASQRWPRLLIVTFVDFVQSGDSRNEVPILQSHGRQSS